MGLSDDYMIPGYDDGDYLIIGGDDDEYDDDEYYDGFELPLWAAMPCMVVLATCLCIVAFYISYKHDRFVVGSSSSRSMEQDETPENSGNHNDVVVEDGDDDPKKLLERGLSVRKYGHPFISARSSHTVVSDDNDDDDDDDNSFATRRSHHHQSNDNNNNCNDQASALSFSSSSSPHRHYPTDHHGAVTDSSSVLLQMLTQPRCVLCSSAFVVGEDVAHSYDQTKCSHTFHRDCLTKYWNVLHPENDGNCPVCKERFIGMTSPPPTTSMMTA